MKRNDTLKLSIIVPVYNVEKHLERCVDSLLHQDIDKLEYEIILINDGSTDQSYAIAQTLKAQHCNIVLYSQENKGQSAARNVGMDLAKGKYLMFVDSDDFLRENVLDGLIQRMDGNHLDMCFFRFMFEYEDGRHCLGGKQGLEKEVIYDGEYIVLNDADMSSVWRSIYLTKTINDYGIRFHEGILHEDADFNYRLYPLLKRVMFTDLSVYCYCVYGESSTRTIAPEKVRKIIESDFFVAKSLGVCLKDEKYPQSIKAFYAKVRNSIIVSCLLQLANNDKIDREVKLECFRTAKQLGVYPIKGLTLTWKTTLLGHLFNCEWLCKCFITRTKCNC